MSIRIIALMVCFIFISCAGPEKVRKRPDMHDSEDLSWIENSDFVSPDPALFEVDSDEYKNDLATLDSLSRETLGKIPEPILMDISDNLDDSLSSVMSACYRRDFAAADKIFDSIYRKYKEHPGYWNLIGSCYLIDGNNRKALLFYNKAKVLSDTFAAPLNNIGIIFQREGSDQRALLAYKKAATLNPFSVTPKFNIAQLYLKYGMAKKAIALYREILKRKSEDVDIISGLATSYLMIGEYKKAIYLFEKIDESHWERPDVGINMAYALYLNKRKDDALVVFEKVDLAKNKRWANYHEKIEGLLK